MTLEVYMKILIIQIRDCQVSKTILHRLYRIYNKNIVDEINFFYVKNESSFSAII